MVDDPRRRPVDELPPRQVDDASGTRDDEKPTRDGDVLGLSDAPAHVKLPRPPGPSGNPAGIEVGPASNPSPTGELSRGTGATGIDMGSGGTGTDIAPKASRPRSAESPEE